MKKLLMPLLALLFCGAAMTACDEGDKEKDKPVPDMPSTSDFGGGSGG